MANDWLELGGQGSAATDLATEFEAVDELMLVDDLTVDVCKEEGAEIDG